MIKNTQQHTFFWMRNFLILGQILLWLIAKTLWQIDYPIYVLFLSACYFLLNLFLRFFKLESSDTQIFINLLIDVSELTLFFYLTGGASNPFTWFLIAPIIFSATVLSQKFTWIITGYANLCYALLIKYFQPIEVHTSMQGMNHSMQHSTSFGQHLIGMWLGFIVLSVLISWVIIGLLKNIRQKEYLLIQAHAKQAEHDKILALATLATGSAHELGTPLSTINIIIKEMLNDKTLANHHKMLNIIESQIFKCKESLTQITASTGTTQAIEGQLVTVHQFLKRIKNQLILPCSKQIHFSKTQESHNKLHIDRTLVQALVNIITNALESKAKNINIETTINTNQLRLNIRDDGEGLKSHFGIKAQSEKEFGMGLGLFLAKTTIERFSGEITIITTGYSGTTLQITLPMLSNE